VELPSTEPAAVLVGAVVDDVLVEDDDDDVEDEEPGVELDVVVDGAVVLVDVDVEVLDEDVVVAPDVVVVWLNAGRARPATAAVTPAAAISRRRWRRLNPCPPSIGNSSLDTSSSPSCSPGRARLRSGREEGIRAGVI